MGLTRLSHGDTGEHSPSLVPVFNSAWGQTTETRVCTAGALPCLWEINVHQRHWSYGDSGRGGEPEGAAASPGQVGRAAATWCNRAIMPRNLCQAPAGKCHIKSKLAGGERRDKILSTSRIKTSINPLFSLVRQRNAQGSLLRPSPAISLYQSIINHCQVKDISIINES